MGGPATKLRKSHFTASEQDVAHEVPEAVWKPLGKGYEHFPKFFLQYCSRSIPSEGNPDLAMSLDAFCVPEARHIIQRVGDRPRCLIQGITCPYNGTSLYRYLTQASVIDPKIHAIDIMDVGAIGRAEGFELTDLDFSVGDASNLTGWADKSIQILVQDHLLNCCPHGSHEAVLREAARVLDPKGILILNFSVDPPADGRGAMSWRESGGWLQSPLNGRAYCLKDVVGNGRRLEEFKSLLLGRVITDGRRQVLVTRPYGNFEFYSSYAALEELLVRFGLRFVFVTSSRAAGPGGGGCLRYRTLVRHVRGE